MIVRIDPCSTAITVSMRGKGNLIEMNDYESMRNDLQGRGFKIKTIYTIEIPP